MEVVSAWSWECRPPASVQCIGNWGHLCSRRLLGVQSYSYLNQCEDILSLIGIKTGSWIKNSPVSTHVIAEPSLSPLSKWWSSSSWAVGISLLLSLIQTNFLGLTLDRCAHPVLSDRGFCYFSAEECIIRLCVTCWQIAPSVSLRGFVQSFMFYLFLKYNF